MAYISKITLPNNGGTYDIKDAEARTLIENLNNYTAFLGVTTTELTDGASTNPILIGTESTTATSGSVAIYGKKEFIFAADGNWHEFGDLSTLKALAFADSASGTYTPLGTISAQTFTGTEGTVSVSGNSVEVSGSTSGTATYTPEGTVSTPTITVTPTTDSASLLNAAGEVPSLSTTVNDETLTFTWSAGSMPTFDTKTVVTSATASSSQPTFSGTGTRLTTGTLSASGNYTPAGTVSQATFTGTSATITVAPAS